MYKIEFVKAARKTYERIPKDVRKTIRNKLMKLAEDPFKPYNEVTSLVGFKQTYRLRVRDWRVVYCVHAGVLIIEVLKVDHRRKVYR